MTPAPMPRIKLSTYTLEEKRALIELLLETWLAAPGLQLGHVLTAATVNEGLLFSLSDLELQKCLASFKERVAR